MTEVIERTEPDFRENVIFDSRNIVKVECYSNEYAAELVQEMQNQGMMIVKSENPRLAIGIRES